MSDFVKLHFSKLVSFFKLVKEISSILSNDCDVMIVFIEPLFDLVKVLAIVEMLIVIRTIHGWHNSPWLSINIILDALSSQVKLNTLLQLIVS